MGGSRGRGSASDSGAPGAGDAGDVERTGCEYVPQPRVPRRKRPAAERVRDFDPVVLPPVARETTSAARRCFAASVCRACDVCVLICPDLCVTRDPSSRRLVIDLAYCKGCGLCAHYCPKGAIRMELDR